MARPPRLERGTLCLEGRCSIQLSYGRTVLNYAVVFQQSQGWVRHKRAALPFADELDDGAVGEDDIGFVLQGVEVVFGKGVAFFGGDEESAGLLDECAGSGRGEGFL